MKTLILGQQNTGKTQLILDEIIPTLEQYMYFDFFGNPALKNTPSQNIVEFRGLHGIHLKQKVIQAIQSCDSNTTLIFDDARMIYFPNYSRRRSEFRNGYDWFLELLHDKSVVLVLHGIDQIQKTALENYFDTLILLPTRDDPREFLDFMLGIDSNKVSVHVILPYNHPKYKKYQHARIPTKNHS